MSAFQKKMRGSVDGKLTDHICKEMNPLNLERCRCIPKHQPGADWRVLQQIVEADPAREKFQASPACSNGTSQAFRISPELHSQQGSKDGPQGSELT